MNDFRTLVVAKAPVAGLAKTRLCPPATPTQAADIAAASLLDTMDTALAVSDTVVALTGDVASAERSAEIAATLRRATVVPQRGDTFADRLAAAHHDAACDRPVLQLGMDTPQVHPDLLRDAGSALDGVDAVLGLADDGGWWALGLHESRHAETLRTVPMSTEDTGELTLRALRSAGLRVAILPTLSDVDTMAVAERVAAETPHGRFAAAVRALELTGAGR